MERNKILLKIAIVLLILNLSGIVYFWVKKPVKVENFKKINHTEQTRHESFENRMANKLNLNIEQRDQYKKLKKDHMEKIIPIHESIKQKKWNIHQEIMSEHPDTNYIEQVADSIGLLSGEFEKLNYHHFLQLKQILNNEQLDNFKGVLDNLRSHKERRSKKYSGNN